MDNKDKSTSSKDSTPLEEQPCSSRTTYKNKEDSTKSKDNRSEKKRAYYQRNKKAILEKQKHTREQHPDKVREKEKRSRDKNRDKKRERDRERQRRIYEKKKAQKYVQQTTDTSTLSTPKSSVTNMASTSNVTAQIPQTIYNNVQQVKPHADSGYIHLDAASYYNQQQILTSEKPIFKKEKHNLQQNLSKSRKANKVTSEQRTEISSLISQAKTNQDLKAVKNRLDEYKKSNKQNCPSNEAESAGVSQQTINEASNPLNNNTQDKPNNTEAPNKS